MTIGDKAKNAARSVGDKISGDDHPQHAGEAQTVSGDPVSTKGQTQGDPADPAALDAANVDPDTLEDQAQEASGEGGVLGVPGEHGPDYYRLADIQARAAEGNEEINRKFAREVDEASREANKEQRETDKEQRKAEHEAEKEEREAAKDQRKAEREAAKEQRKSDPEVGHH